MSQDAQLFKTPSLEAHLATSMAAEIDQALTALNEEGGFPTDPAGLKELVVSYLEIYAITPPPSVDEPHMTFHNDRNILLATMVPIAGNIYFLTYQVRTMPPPVFVGQVHFEGEAGTIAFTYKLKETGARWESAIDGDMALLKTYIGATAGAIATFNAGLPALIEAKIKETIAFNALRQDIATKMGKRGFTEV